MVNLDLTSIVIGIATAPPPNDILGINTDYASRLKTLAKLRDTWLNITPEEKLKIEAIIEAQYHGDGVKDNYSLDDIYIDCTPRTKSKTIDKQR